MELTAEQIKLINIIDQFFIKADNARVPHLYTTGAVFEKLQSIYPSASYTHEDVYEVMTYGKFETINSSSGKIYWLMQDKNSSK